VLDHAISIAEPYDATITALYVVDTRVVRSATARDPDDVRSELESDGERALELAVERGENAGLTVESSIREGNPEREIRAVSEDIDADLVVTGNHGKSPREKVEGLGSVSEAVVTKSQRPVLVSRLSPE
ncbi:MAG: universal stress protein, partial [Halanaeroarchaeum sp.]